MGAAFSPAFLNGEAHALAFLPDDFREPSRRATRVRQAAQRGSVVSARVLASLREQAARLGPITPARGANLDALGQPGTVVAVTGQQVGLFLGPLYSFYKAASCISVARALTNETGVRCVPVFWLQSEDHDVAEIDHCVVGDLEGQLHRLRLAGPPGDSRRSVSSLSLGAGVEAVLAELEASLEGAPHRAEVMTLLRTHYTPEAGWVKAFAGVLSACFGGEGLVVLDPREPALVAEARTVHERALRAAPELALVLGQRTEALEAAGFDVQVKVRDAALSFVHPEGFDGPRMRPALDHLPSPEGAVFSSSALLRPIVQDSLLPTAAIVVGPGELNYFAQMGPLYEWFGLPPPMLVPRARFRVVEARQRSHLAKLGLSAGELEQPREQVLERLSGDDDGLTAAQLEARLTQAVEPVLAQVPADPTLGDALERTRATIARAASRLAARYSRTRSLRDATLVGRVDRLQQVLFPGGAPQERVLSWPHFASRLGSETFKSLVFSALDPFAGDVKELAP